VTIASLKDLQKLIALCRRTGVQSIRIDGIELHLGDIPYKAQRASQVVTSDGPKVTFSPGNVTEETKITVASDWDLLSDEQRLFYSSRPETPSVDEQQ
jgi:hypothetical protein